jgi:D-ribose pyranose/furanose isomerase RbsD
MTSGAMTPVPKDHPLMIAWAAYQGTEDFKNTMNWATRNIVITTAETAPEANRVNPEEERTRRALGNLWAAFMAGFKAGTERAASLHEQINPASDDERHNNVPGAGAMGAVIEYRDQIRTAHP